MAGLRAGGPHTVWGHASAPTHRQGRDIGCPKVPKGSRHLARLSGRGEHDPHSPSFPCPCRGSLCPKPTQGRGAEGTHLTLKSSAARRALSICRTMRALSTLSS